MRAASTATVVTAPRPEPIIHIGGGPDATGILDLLTGFNVAAIEASSLDLDVQVLVRVAALVAIDAPPASYLINLEAGDQVGVTVEQVQGVLCTIAPIVGTARVVSAGGKMVRALGLELELAELEAEE